MNARSLWSLEKPSVDFAQTAATALALAMAFALAIVAIPAAQAQTYKVLYSFTGGADGAQPLAGLTMDASGNLYGTTISGGTGNCPGSCGTVFNLSHSGAGWALNTLYSFAGGNDAAGPGGRVLLARDGTLYGTTEGGGVDHCEGNGCGTVFHLRPSATAPKSATAPWNETVLYRFTGYSDGSDPQGDLAFDQFGNIYGTARGFGSNWLGVIYELTPSDGGWQKNTLYSAQGGSGDGAAPSGGVIFDRAGSLYGVYWCNGYYGDGYGAVYELSQSQSRWTERILHEFTGGIDGGKPYGGLVSDSNGNLYGTTTGGGSGGGGTVFELTPANDGWSFNTIYSFSGPSLGGPEDKLTLDGAGNLYGTTLLDGAYGAGSVFKLTPSNGGWTYRSLHDFCASGYPCSDGSRPSSNLIFDANGNLYGTTISGGLLNCGEGCGVVFEITP